MGIRQHVEYGIILLIGLFFTLLVLPVIAIQIICHPIKAIKTIFWPKKRDVMPACLNDPTLGSHGFIHLKEVRLHYVASGDESKPLMLFIHGFPEFWYSWRHQIREFKKDYRVVAIDMRGYADSDKPSGVEAYKTEKMIGDIKQLIPALGYRTCVLVAHDWGGILAYEFIAKHQDMVDKLIVMNAPHFGNFMKYIKSNKSQALKSWYIAFFQVPWIPEMMISMFDYDGLKQMFSNVKKKSDEALENDIEAYRYAASRPGGLTNPLNYYKAVLRFPPGKHIYITINKPVLVIWGCKDMALNKELAELPSKFIPNLTVKYIEDASHMVQMDNPDEVNRLMREWLSS